MAKKERGPQSETKNTFGSYESGLTLEKIVKELNSSQLTSKISRIYHRFNFFVNQIANIPSKSVEGHVLLLLFKETEKTINDYVAKTEGKERLAWTHLRTTVTSVFRDTMQDVREERAVERALVRGEQQALNEKGKASKRERIDAEASRQTQGWMKVIENSGTRKVG